MIRQTIMMLQRPSVLHRLRSTVGDQTFSQQVLPPLQYVFTPVPKRGRGLKQPCKFLVVQFKVSKCASFASKGRLITKANGFRRTSCWTTTYNLAILPKSTYSRLTPLLPMPLPLHHTTCARGFCQTDSFSIRPEDFRRMPRGVNTYNTKLPLKGARRPRCRPIHTLLLTYRPLNLW